MLASYLATYLIGLVASLALVPVVIQIAQKYNCVDIPNVRSVHVQPIARLGGIGIFTSFLMAIVCVFALGNAAGGSFREQWAPALALLLGSTTVFIVGIYDDLNGVRIRYKLCAQFVGAMGLSLVGARITHVTVQGVFDMNLGWTSYPLTCLWIIGVTNAINLIDGLDGLAGGISAIACAAFAAMATIQGDVVVAILMLGLFGSLTGFLFYNSHPAKIFMGDCGSLFLGFTIAAVSVLRASESHSLAGVAFPVLVLGLPILDTLFSMLRRFLERRGLTSPDKAHFHHMLLRRGLTQPQVALIACGITLVMSSLGLLMLTTRGIGSMLILATGMAFYVLIFRKVGAAQLVKTLQGIRDRSALIHVQRMERKAFEEAQLHFKNASDFDEWWQSICVTAKIMGFSSVSLKTAARDGSFRKFHWKNPKHPNLDSDPGALQVNVRISDRRRGSHPSFKVMIPIRESLEAAGRKSALFMRLADEYGLGSIPG